MAVYSYRLANGQTRWFFIIDLPPDSNGPRRQHKRQGFPHQARCPEGRAGRTRRLRRGGPRADGSVTAEMESWLNERELDVQETTLSNYRARPNIWRLIMRFPR
ncbi:hypothetical protein [Micromonospora sp. DT233]|uniref:hypothetical protein n=1 Tax=Micromonospora sp. DT233 TaxID=3393432 RepID=UPI003CECA8EC